MSEKIDIVKLKTPDGITFYMEKGQLDVLAIIKGIGTEVEVTVSEMTGEEYRAIEEKINVVKLKGG